MGISRYRNYFLVFTGLLVSMVAVAQEDIRLCQEGWASYSSGKYEEAIRLYEGCIQSGQLTQATLARTYRNLGMAHNAKKGAAQAVDYYTRALALNPVDFWSDYVNRGNAWSYLKEDDKALADYEAALKAKPDLGAAHYNRAIVYERLGRTEQAKADLTQAYAKGYRSTQLSERMALYQLPTSDEQKFDPDKPLESTEQLSGVLKLLVSMANGKFTCFEKSLTLADVRPVVQEELRRKGLTAPTANQTADVLYTLYPCPFAPIRPELKLATQAEMEGVWVFPESSYQYRYSPQSANWKQEPPPSMKMCDGIGFYAGGEMRVMRKGGPAGSCPFIKAGDLDIARQLPRVSSWNMIRDGRLNVRRTDVANHVEEWDFYLVKSDFEASGLQVRQGNLIGYQRKLPGNDRNVATMFWHLQKLPQ